MCGWDPTVDGERVARAAELSTYFESTRLVFARVDNDAAAAVAFVKRCLDARYKT